MTHAVTACEAYLDRSFWAGRESHPDGHWLAVYRQRELPAFTGGGTGDSG